MLVGIITSTLVVIDQVKVISARRAVAAYVLKNYKHESEERLKMLIPYPIAIKWFAPYLEQQQYNVFRQK